MKKAQNQTHLLPLPLLCSSVTPLWWSCDDAWLARHEGFPKPIIILSFWLGHTEEDTVNWIRHSLSAFHRPTAGYAGSGIKLIILNLKLVLRLTYSTFLWSKFELGNNVFYIPYILSLTY